MACAEFLAREMRDERGRLLRSYNDGEARITAYLEDHAFLLEALLVLFETTCEERWLTEARRLADEMIERFADDRGGRVLLDGDGRRSADRPPQGSGGLADTRGSSSAANGLLRLAQITGEEAYERHAVSVLRLLADIAPRYPVAFGHLLQAMYWHLAPARPLACPVPAVPTGSTGSGRAPSA